MTEYMTTLPDGGLVGGIAQHSGVPEAALRLLFSVLAGYPIAAFYCKLLVHVKVKTLHHLYFASCGVGLCYFNYGWDTYHTLLGILTTYLLAVLLRQRSQLFLTLNFVFHMSYLLLGYYFTATNEYDILWTMPQCILVQRMIGFGFDVTDGLKPEADLSKDQKETALPQLPNPLEVLAFAYFPSSFLVGPQFPYRRYQKFVQGDYREHDGQLEAGLKRFGMGIVYLIICQVGLRYLPDAYFLTQEFAEVPFIRRVYYLGFWAKFTLYKYISCWLLTEGALICIGITYKGQDQHDQADWSGCSNVKLMLLETGNTMEHYVHSFNVNTNQWVGLYVYKRLKFLNNRNISYGAALGFLALWHGYHSGYYMTFLMEYLVVNTEKQITRFYTKEVLPKYGHILENSDIYKLLYFFTLKSYNIVYMGWCLTAFVFLKYERWIQVYQAVNYFGFTYMLIWAVVYRGYCYFLRKPKGSGGSSDTATVSSNVPANSDEKKAQ